MQLAEVKGLVVGDSKTDWIDKPTFLIVQTISSQGKVFGTPFVALDPFGCKTDEIVFITQGSSCRQTDETKDKPVDALICGIVDNVEANGLSAFKKDIGFLK